MKRLQWQGIVGDFHQSNLSKRAFAENRKLVYSQQLNWFRQFEGKQSEARSKGDDLVPVTIKPVPTPKQNTILGVIEFPNGTRFNDSQSQLTGSVTDPATRIKACHFFSV